MEFSQQFVHVEMAGLEILVLLPLPSAGKTGIYHHASTVHQATSLALLRASFKAHFGGPMYAWSNQMFPKGTFGLGR